MPLRLPSLFGFTAWTWLLRLGGPGLILLGLADNSVVPLPGSMDVLTIVLAGSHHELWWYYALMATIGSLIGGYITYRLSRKGGKEAFEKRFPKKRVEKVYRTFERWGFWSVAVPALLPPPVPIVPFLVAAGAMQYSRRKFAAALALGRACRFLIVAYIAAHYGQHIFRFFSKYYKPALYSLIALAVAGGIVGLYFYLRHRKGDKKEKPERDKGQRITMRTR